MKNLTGKNPACRRTLLLCLLVVSFMACPAAIKKTEAEDKDLAGIPAQMKTLVKNIHWYGNAAIKIEAGGKILFFDPFQIPEGDKADIIFITHPHFDHLSEGDIRKAAKPDTIFVTPENQECINVVKKISGRNPVTLVPGDEKVLAGIKIKAVPSYNIVKKENHPKSMGWLGYVVTLPGSVVYIAGDTELIPEMKTFTCDIAMLPLGRTYTMGSVEDAAQAALDVKAKVAIPIHYGVYEGTLADAMKFKELLAGKIDVIIKSKE